MQYSSQHGHSITLLRGLLLVPALMLAGCGGGGGGGSASSGAEAPDTTAPTASAAGGNGKTTSTTSEITLTGVAMKGTLSNAIVTAHAVELQAGYAQPAPTPLAAVRTATDGSYSLKIAAPTNGRLVIKVSADGGTRMLCDVTDGCEDFTGAVQAFGTPLALPETFSLFAAVNVGTGKEQTVHVSPLTHLAYEWAAGQSAGLTAENISTGRTSIATTLDLPSNILEQRPLDLTKLSSMGNVDKNVLNYSILSASFLALAQSPNWQGVDEVLTAAADRFATTGRLINVNLGGLPEITKSDLYYAAADIAGDLAQSSSNATGSKLTEIAHASSSAADSMVSASTPAEPVHITFNPSSVTLYRNESVTFNVNASGTGPISYQWRKNGVAISGATSQHLTLSAVALTDAGLYDCVVSNELGSVVSLTATLTVEIPDVTLAWSAPTSRVDGTPLDHMELRGYRLIYGTSASELNQTVEIEDPYATQYTFDGLPSNTYFFAIKAIDDDGNESALSGVVSKTL